MELHKVLAQILGFCQTESGKERVKNLMPCKTKKEAESILNSVDDFLRYGEFIQIYLPFRPGVLKMEVVTGPYLKEERLIQLRDFLKHCSELKKRFKKTFLMHYFNFSGDYSYIIKEIERIIDETGIVKDGASKELKRIRLHKRKLQTRIKSHLDAILKRKPNCFSNLTICQRDGRYVLPLRTGFKKEIPGIVHSFSNSGETVFIEPMENIDDAAEMVEMEIREKEETERILKRLTKLVQADIEDIESDISRIVELDLLFARTQYAREFKQTRPIFGEYINIKDGYHPLLKKIKEDVVSLNLRLNSEQRILLISGPNAGGKTVVLKTVGLINLMARCGLFIPADESTTIPFFDEIYADIGDEQSIESNVSTFAGHLIQIKKALEGSENSLVLLDELMSQTSAEEGSALAASILEEFARKKAFVLATTHNEDLKIFVSNEKEMQNAGMEWTTRPTYRLIVGIPQPSNAIKFAHQFGFGKNILKRAVSYLDQDKVQVNELFESLSREFKIAEEQRKTLEGLKRDYEGKLKDFNLKKKKELDEMRKRYKGEMIQAKRSIERLINQLKREGPRQDIVKETRKIFEKPVVAEEKFPYHPKLGEIVQLRELKTSGQVVARHKGRYKINLDNIIYWANPEEIEPLSIQND